MRTAKSTVLVVLLLTVSITATEARRLNGTLDWWETDLLSPYDIEVTPDGLVWFTTGLAVVRFNPSTGSTLAYHPLGTGNMVKCLDQDEDQNLWIAEFNGDRILKFDTATGMFAYYNIPAGTFPGGCSPFGVTVASPTEIWFTCDAVNSLGRLDPTGPSWTRFMVNGNPLPDPPVEIAFDSQGKAWFSMRTDAGGSPGFGWIDPADPTTPTSNWITSSSFSKPHGIIFHRGSVWLVDHGWNLAESQIVRINPNTHSWASYQLPDEVDDAHFLTVGPKGRLYTAGYVSASLALFDPVTLTFQTEWVGDGDIWPMGVATGPDGRVWYADAGHPAAGEGGIGLYTPMGPSSLVIGSYEGLAGEKEGAVAVLYASTRSGVVVDGNQLWTYDSPGIPTVPESNDLFGHAVASGDFDGDGGMDLAIGVPGKNVSGFGNAGAVQVLYGRRGDRLSAVGTQMWTQDTGTIEGGCEADDRFGWAVAAGDFNNDGYDDLAVGIPYEHIGTVSDAGAVQIILGSAAGLTDAGNKMWYQGLDIANTPEAADRFGESLAAGDFDGDGWADLAIGVPHENWGTSINDSGVVQVLYGTLGGLSWSGDQIWHQALAGIQDDAEDGDLFGQALAAGDFNRDGFWDLAVGVPQETLDGVIWAGVVAIIPGSASGLTDVGDQLFSQGNPSIDGVLEADDRFGWSLTSGDFNGDWYDDLAVGVPFEGVGTPTEDIAAGAVNVLYGGGSGLHASGSHYVHQDSPGIGSFTEPYDRFGERLAAGDFDDDGYADLVVAATFEDLTGENEGVVHVIYGGIGGISADSDWFHQDLVDILDTGETLDRFGWSVTTAGGLADVLFIDGLERNSTVRWSFSIP